MLYKIVVASSIAAAAAFAPATVGEVKDPAWETLCVRSISNLTTPRSRSPHTRVLYA